MRVVVTGGSRGIGLAIVKRCLAAGHAVVSVSREKGESLPEAVEQAVFDLERVADIPALMDRIGPADVLVNNAGIMNALPYDDYPEERKRALLAVNLEAPVALIREFARLAGDRGGRIVNVASIAGEVGHPDVWYGATKAGLINATRSFAKVLAPQGIIVNAVAPGPVGTEMTKTIPSARREELLKRTYLGRPAHPEEVAAVVYWLIAEAPGYLNGECIDFNNGAFSR